MPLTTYFERKLFNLFVKKPTILRCFKVFNGTDADYTKREKKISTKASDTSVYIENLLAIFILVGSSCTYKLE